MSQQEVPNGWVKLRNPKQVPERLRRPLLVMSAEGVKAFGDGSEGIEQDFTTDKIQFFSEWNDKLALAMISEWSFGEVSEAVLLDLPGATYDAVRELVAPFVADLLPSFAASPDPKAPTAN